MNCKKCGAELAENQRFCPYCGEAIQTNEQPENNAQSFPINTSTYNTPQPKPKKKKRWIIAVIIGVIVIAAVNANSNNDSKTSTKTNATDISTQSNKSSDNTTSKADTISQPENHKYEDTDYVEIYNNPDNYKDKYVRIFGKISSIGKNITNHAYITFEEGIEEGITHSIYCNISDEQKDTVLSKYAKDDYIAIEGKVGNKTIGSVDINDCFVTLDGEKVKTKIADFEKQKAIKIEKSKEEYKKDCKSYTYKEISRNPKNYVGKKAKFEGEVVQVMENKNSVTLRVNVTKTENSLMESGYLYSDTIYVEYTRKSDSESRILDDDIVTMYGVLNGTKSYSSVLGGEVTIPLFNAEYIDIQNE